MDSQGKKILFVCNYFAPNNAVAAIRITKMVKYLTLSGYEITVIAEERSDNQEDELLKREVEGIPVYRVVNSAKINNIIRFFNKLIKKSKEKRYQDLDNRIKFNKKSGKSEFYPFETAYPLIGSMDYLLELLRQYDLSVQAREVMKKFAHYDICISSYGDNFGLFAGLFLKKKLGLKWILDVRDPICSYKFTPSYVWKIAQKLESKAGQNADSITAVTETMCKKFKNKYPAKAYCITNGYDLSDRKQHEQIVSTSSKMKITYTGAMYGGLQNLSILFECIKELSNEELIDINNIEFHFAGRESAFQIFYNQAKQQNLERYCINHGRVPRIEALRLQEESHLLLAVVWDYEVEPAGTISGKLLEYMSAKRPIVIIINSDYKENEAAKIVDKCQLGIAYEQSNHEYGKAMLKKYLSEKYHEFIEKGEVTFYPNMLEIEKYDYVNIVKKMNKVIQSI